MARLLVGAVPLLACGCAALVLTSPDEGKSARDALIAGRVVESCLGSPPLRGATVRLVTNTDRVLDEEVTGIDGRFVLRASPTTQMRTDNYKRLRLEVGGVKYPLPEPEYLFSLSAGSYRFEGVVPCNRTAAWVAPPDAGVAPAQPAAGSSPREERQGSEPKKPPSPHLIPKGYLGGG